MAILKQKVAGVAVNRTVTASYDDNMVVHRSGNEGIAGTKTFSESPLVPTVADTNDNSQKAASTAFVQSVVTTKGVRISQQAGNAINNSPDGLAMIVDINPDNALRNTANGWAVNVSPDPGNILKSSALGLMDESGTYNTYETHVGWWIDGKPIYRMVIDFSSMIPTAAGPAFVCRIPFNTAVDTFVSLRGTLAGSQYIHEMPYAQMNKTGTTLGLSAISSVYYEVSSQTIEVRWNGAVDSYTKRYVIIEYTKA